jgi:DNA polymerase (family 10)
MVMVELNWKLAELFQSIADSLADQDANPHRIRAYRRAATSIRGLHEDVAAIAGRGELKTIPGIGRDLAAKIEEFLATGTVQAQKTAATPLPPEIAAWTSLPGLSESLVQHLYNRLGIGTLEDLETLVRSHMLRTLPGFAADEGTLLAAIKAMRQADRSG